MTGTFGVSTPVSGVRRNGHHVTHVSHHTQDPLSLQCNTLSRFAHFGTPCALQKGGFSEGGHGA
jgi:hypothetical protein